MPAAPSSAVPAAYGRRVVSPAAASRPMASGVTSARTSTAALRVLTAATTCPASACPHSRFADITVISSTEVATACDRSGATSRTSTTTAGTTPARARRRWRRTAESTTTTSSPTPETGTRAWT
ncbi:hypothetical protein, partial [Lapillicoccus sp.]|uniref:hypothetical protein n=1 Tax=Lapillicoccus sp. TaxID=1909287 RepID=UPI0025F4931E